MIRKREVATATVATFATVAPIRPLSVATVASVAVANSEADGTHVVPPDCIGELTRDYADLKMFIAELCRIVRYTEDARVNMLAACRNLYPFQVSAERDYFRLQVERAMEDRYWTGDTSPRQQLSKGHRNGDEENKGSFKYTPTI